MQPSLSPSREPLRYETRKARPLTLLALTVSLAAPALSHEFWIEPLTFAPAAGGSVGVRLFVGDGFENPTPYARNPRHLRSFFVETGERQPVEGRPGGDPAGRVTAPPTGSLLIGYESGPSSISLAADRFEHYLLDEGLEHVVERRRELGESELEGREEFSRAAKSLLRVADVGHTGSRGFERRLGLAVEIVPEADPTLLRPSVPLGIVVLRHGEPLTGAQVRVFRRGAPEATFAVRTDRSGRASVPLARPGVWLLSVVHMERAPAGGEVDWLSTWSSFTFSNQPPASAPLAEAATSTLEEPSE